jgi:hypothetical protein
MKQCWIKYIEKKSRPKITVKKLLQRIDGFFSSLDTYRSEFERSKMGMFLQQNCYLEEFKGRVNARDVFSVQCVYSSILTDSVGPFCFTARHSACLAFLS